ncbi:unnamed protein product [Thelazia callipaeda]|uniref:Pept_C1 domain-containing protein n=1 Tax=Thelazia callipaeda TaxID=103827 RepID=A0A0N5D8F6_THECL|nr:unnamed protein product [Thelazia callipaeda]
MAIFESNSIRVAEKNKLYRQGNISYLTKLNDLADLTDEEYLRMSGMKILNHVEHPRNRSTRQAYPYYYQYNRYDQLPNYVDWRRHNIVTSVKNQGDCGSCYAFAALGALESYHRLKTGRLIDLSPQNIIDCTNYLGNKGCRGGFTATIFTYARTYGVLSNGNYPYEYYTQNYCRWRRNSVEATDEGFYQVNYGDELALKHAVAKTGPVVAAIAASRWSFRFYRSEALYSSSGIYADRYCGYPNHAVLVVGYGTDRRYGDYWIIKNSWGTRWGMNGYAFIARNRNNMCHIASFSMLPR